MRIYMASSKNSNGHLNGSFGNMVGDLQDQEAASLNRRLEPSSPDEFIKWVQQSLREQRQKANKIKEEHIALVKSGELATVGLTRLGGLVRFKGRLNYEKLVDLHRDFTFKNKDIGNTITRVTDVLNETTLNMQFVGETLTSALADRHKKIAVQKELGLRLRDTDSTIDIARREVDHQNKIYGQLSQGIQKLMHEAKLKLPAEVQEKINREDAIAKMAITHKSSLEKGHDVINSKKYIPPVSQAKVKMFSGLGEEAASHSAEETPPAIDKPTGIDAKFAMASTTIGVILGILIFFVLKKK